MARHAFYGISGIFCEKPNAAIWDEAAAECIIIFAVKLKTPGWNILQSCGHDWYNPP